MAIKPSGVSTALAAGAVRSISSASEGEWLEVDELADLVPPDPSRRLIRLPGIRHAAIFRLPQLSVVGAELVACFFSFLMRASGNRQRLLQAAWNAAADLSEGDNERLSHAANDAAFVTCLRNVGDCVLLLIRDGIMMGVKVVRRVGLSA